MRRVIACAVLLVLLAAFPAAARDPITPLADVHRGMRCTALTVVHGTTISSFDVEVLDVVAGVEGLAPRILVRVSGPAVDDSGVASGMSGSPVYCPAVNAVVGNAGAISATIGEYGNEIALVTPIEEMLGIDALPPTGIRKAPRLLRSARPLAAPVSISGLDPVLGRVLEREARKRGRVLVAAPVGPLATFSPQPLVPGASLAVGLSSGDIRAGVIGTVTYRDGSTVYGFGHEFEAVGRRSLPLQDAYVFGVISNPIGFGPLSSWKLAAPGHTVGTLTSDQLAGVVGSVGAGPTMVPLSVRVRDEDRDREAHVRAEMADEVDVGNPDGEGWAPLIAWAGVLQGALDAVGAAPVEESGHLCLRVRMRELRKPLRFCNRYVVAGFPDGFPTAAGRMAEDVLVALASIDNLRFAALHLTSVSVSARIERGMRLATIVGVDGPRIVRPGKKVRLRLRVRMLRGPLRTLRVTTRIPRRTPPGPRPLVIEGTPPDGEFFGGEDAYEYFDEFFGFGGGRSPQSLREVRERFEARARWDGVTARIGRRDWRLLRDERVRIDGRAKLNVIVVGKRRRGGRALRPLLRPPLPPTATVPGR